MTQLFNRITNIISRHKIPIFILCLFAVSLWGHSRERGTTVNTPIDTTRTVITTQKQDSQKVILEYADELVYNQFTTPDFQKLRGNVRFRRGGMYMYCDSAYFYEAKNAMDAYGHVRMEQGDTLFAFGDTLYYDGNTSMARLRSRVILKNRDVTLYTDSLNYDQNENVGYYYTGGEIDDTKNNLKSVYGEYSTDTKDAKFFFNVELTGDGVKMYTDSLRYNTDTKIVRISSPTEIISDSGIILSNRGWYNTITDRATLYNRSIVINGSNKLTGDTIFYDKVLGKGEVFGNMHLEDTVQHLSVMGNYGYYYNNPESALVVDSAQMIDASQADTLYLHADTLRIVTLLDTAKQSKQKTVPNSISYRSRGAVTTDADSTEHNMEHNHDGEHSHRQGRPSRRGGADVEQETTKSQSKKSKKSRKSKKEDTTTSSSRGSSQSGTLPPRLAARDSIANARKVADSLSIAAVQIDSLSVTTTVIDSLSVSTTEIDSLSVSTTEIDSISYIINTQLPDTLASKGVVSLQKVTPQNDSISYTDTLALVQMLDTLALAQVPDSLQSDSMPTDTTQLIKRVVKAYNNTRFFRKDVQGVCDSMVFISADSLLTLFDNPIIWSGAKQVLGDTIMVYLNDSTIDRVYIPSYPFVIEQKDTAFFDQISGKELTAYFVKGYIDKVDVSGNVQTIFYPQEEDSTFIGLNNAVSSYLSLLIDRETNTMKSLSMWPQVEGSLTPIKMLKQKDLYLPNFKWVKDARPKSPSDIFRKVEKTITTENKPRRKFSTSVEE